MGLKYILFLIFCRAESGTISRNENTYSDDILSSFGIQNAHPFGGRKSLVRKGSWKSINEKFGRQEVSGLKEL
jgi:hypothetical protein